MLSPGQQIRSLEDVIMLSSVADCWYYVQHHGWALRKNRIFTTLRPGTSQNLVWSSCGKDSDIC